MNGSGRSLLGLTALAFAAAGCFDDDNNDVLGPRPADALFRSYVALGNSITAGFQSGGINDSTQRRAYPVLLGAQMDTRFAYPSLAGRGCAPPIANFLTQARVGTGSTSSTCDLRNPASSGLINNLGVPGATVADLTAETGSSASNILTSLILGGQTQVERALQAQPTFASIWIGNNDVLVPAITGFLSPTPGASPGIPSQTAFEAEYEEAMDQLLAGAPNLEGVLVGAVNVTAAPILFPVAALQTNPAFLGGFDQASGRVPASTDPFKAGPLTIDANCSTAPTTLVSFRLASEIARFRNDTNATGQPPKDPATRVGHPPHIACGVSGTPWPAPVGEAGILTTTEQATLVAAVNGYNTYIAAKADELGWAYMNPNVLLDSLRTAGQIPVAPNLASGTATFGTWVSLDGVHPSNTTHRALTNHLIDAINATYNTSLERISVP
ncbi:MAG: SGNH/GDSL hydrolase family protein [Gemmatimonadaceae bacterium]